MDEATLPLLAYSGDFRAAAVEASARLLNQPGGSIDPLDVEFSTCTRAGDADEAARRIIRNAILGQVIGVGAIFLAMSGFAIAVLFQEFWVAAVGLIGLVAGLAVMMGETRLRSAAARRVVAARGVADTSAARCVNIENGLTYSRVKWLGEDVALVWADPVRRRVRLEGLTHQYIICDRDVTALSVHRAPALSSTSISYRVGEAELVLVLAENQNNLVEMLKQTLGLRPRLHHQILAAIGPMRQASP